MSDLRIAAARRIGRSIAAFAAAGALVVSSLVAISVPAEAAGVGMAINKGSAQSVIDAYRYWFQPASAVPPNWTGNASSCSAGKVSAAAQKATIDMVNYFRAMAGLDAVTEDAALSAKSQQAALMMTANGQLSHTPPSSWKCYTADGYDGASHSNLSLGWDGYYGPLAVAGQMADLGSSNLPIVGHRRWILKPELNVVGAGSTSSSNSLYVIHSQYNSGATKPAWIPWPSAGFFPGELLAEGQSWSLSASQAADFSGASVAMTKNGAAISTSKYSVANGYGPNTLVWSVPSYSPPAAGKTDVYHVKVTGVSGGAAASYEYDVKVVSAEPTTPLKPAALAVTGSLKVGSTLTCADSGWNATPTTKSYQWYGSEPNGGGNTISRISGATSRTYQLSAADLGRNWVSCVVTAFRAGYQDYNNSALDVARYGPVQPGTFAAATVTVTGTVKVGSTLTASPGNWGTSGVSLTYQWLRDGAAISGATGRSFKLQIADVGKKIAVKVTGSKKGYRTASRTSAAKTIPGVPFKAPASVGYTGTAKVGKTLTATPGSWGTTGVKFAYRWLRNGAAISGATGRTYKAVAADAGKKLTVKITASKTGYNTTSRVSGAKTVAKGTFSLGTVKIKGTAKAGKKLTVVKPKSSVSGVSLTYQWLRNGKVIKKATKTSYKLTKADRGKKVTVKVTAKKAGYVSVAKNAKAVKVKR